MNINEILNYSIKYSDSGLDKALLLYYIKYYELGLGNLNYNNILSHPDITKFNNSSKI